MKRPNKYSVVLVLVLAIVVVLQMSAPKPINWTPSFSGADRIPYGNYVLYEMLPELFPGRDIGMAKLPAYNVLEAGDSAVYMVINADFEPDELDRKSLLEYVHYGSTVFIAAESFNADFADTLDFSVGLNYSPFGDSTSLNFVNPELRRAESYRFKQNTVDQYFREFDTLRATVLGMNGDSQATYIRMPYGHGTFYISTVPYAFTNYNLVSSTNRDYAFAALSYLPRRDVLWDEYYKAGREMTDSPFRYILSQESLTWALYVLLGSAVLFVLFMGRRRQRVIPVIKPLPNTTLEFVHTVGQLYYQHGDHRNLAEKKITYFLEHVRSAYGVSTNSPADDLYRTVAARSGVPLEQVRALFVAIDMVRSSAHLTAHELLDLSTKIEAFNAAKMR